MPGDNHLRLSTLEGYLSQRFSVTTSISHGYYTNDSDITENETGLSIH